MNITAQEEYGIRCMLQIAGEERGKALSASDIGRNEGISVAYANKLLHILRKAKLIKSVRGPQGGFQLARPASEITLADIMRGLESFLFVSNLCACFPGNRKVCVHYSKSCSIRPVWHVMMSEARSLLSRTTLQELSAAPEASVARQMRAKVMDRAQRFRLQGKTPNPDARGSGA